jgi:S-DNA-T family DNA segregation ATPase FtsK/SpoIIIE
MEEQIAYSLGVDAVRVSRMRGTVSVEVQLPLQFHKVLLVKSLRRKEHLWLTLGQTAAGHQVNVNLGGTRYAHALVTATTGGGKTELMKLALWELVAQNHPDKARALVIDGKGGVDWRGFSAIPHLIHPIISDTHDAIGALAWAMAEADRRKDKRPVGELFIFVDEVRELLTQAGGANGPVAVCLQRLTQMGRGLGIHVLMATQHPTADVLGGSLAKANLPMRLVGRVMDANASNLATGQKDLRCHRLYGAGDFLAVDGATAHRFQGALVDERYMGRLPRNGHDEHSIDLTMDISHVSDVVKADDEPQAPARMVAWALLDQLKRGLNKPSATAVRQQFGVGTPRAQVIRDYALELSDELRRLGGGYRLLATHSG